MQRKRIYVQILVNLLLTIALLLLVFFAVPRLLKFFFPFVIGFVISLIANPLVRFMEKKIKIVRKHGSAIIIVLVLAAVIGVLYLLGSLLVHEVTSLVNDLPSIVSAMSSFFDNLSVEFAGIINRLPENMRENFGNLNSTMSSLVESVMSTITLPTLADASSYVKNIANFILYSIVTILASYFMIAERERLSDAMKKILPESVISSYQLVVDNFRSAVGGYFKAQFKIMGIITVILFIVFEVLHVNFSFLLALAVAFLDLLPVFGTGTVLGPWIVIDLVNGNYQRAIVLAVLYLVCQIVKQLLQPKMVGDSIGVSPFAALLFMFVGYQVAGIVGMIIGIPVGMVLISFYKLGMFDRLIQGFRILFSDINDFRKF